MTQWCQEDKRPTIVVSYRRIRGLYDSYSRRARHYSNSRGSSLILLRVSASIRKKNVCTHACNKLPVFSLRFPMLCTSTTYDGFRVQEYLPSPPTVKPCIFTSIFTLFHSFCKTRTRTSTILRFTTHTVLLLLVHVVLVPSNYSIANWHNNNIDYSTLTHRQQHRVQQSVL